MDGLQIATRKEQCRGYGRDYRARYPGIAGYFMMLQRCYNTRNPMYPIYGGRGIAVCSEWLGGLPGYARMLEHIGAKPGPGYSIDRIDNDGNYAPGNVRWASKAQQVRNRRLTVRVSFNGADRTLGDVAAEVGIPYDVMYRRIFRAGHTPEVAAMIAYRPRAGRKE